MTMLPATPTTTPFSETQAGNASSSGHSTEIDSGNVQTQQKSDGNDDNATAPSDKDNIACEDTHMAKIDQQLLLKGMVWGHIQRKSVKCC